MRPQTESVLSYLRAHGSITPLAAQRELGVLRLAARVRELREEGYPIHTAIVAGRTRRGVAHFAEYRLSVRQRAGA